MLSNRNNLHCYNFSSYCFSLSIWIAQGMTGNPTLVVVQLERGVRPVYPGLIRVYGWSRAIFWIARKKNSLQFCMRGLDGRDHRGSLCRRSIRRKPYHREPRSLHSDAVALTSILRQSDFGTEGSPPVLMDFIVKKRAAESPPAFFLKRPAMKMSQKKKLS